MGVGSGEGLWKHKFKTITVKRTLISVWCAQHQKLFPQCTDTDVSHHWCKQNISHHQYW